jgi:ethanolamine ammonia-lyase small subunit
MKPPAPLPDWSALKALTPARVALGRSGNSLPTRALLEFGMAQARARDAVFEAPREEEMRAALEAAGFPTLSVASAAADRQTYLLRPDLGRRLDETSRSALVRARGAVDPDVLFVVADGLSPLARLRHAGPLLAHVRARLANLQLGPVVVAQFARVALGDEIGHLLRAGLVAVLIGERPGLSAPDSLGVYLTHAPKPGCTDAQRNCLSNIRPEGLNYGDAATQLAGLIAGARRLGATGTSLKNEDIPQRLPDISR